MDYRLRTKLLCFTGIAGAAFFTPVQAQEVETTPDQPTTQEQSDDIVVVTGSRIRRENATSAVPLQIFGTEDLEEIGTTDLAEALLQLPGVSESISPQSSNNLIQTSGLSTVSLRRLGDDRTLVLINGKRAVSNSGNSDRVSLSTLPAGFVERTEITTGGASAIYGSDAIAGVANFLLEDDFEGVEFDGRFSTPEASGGDEFRLNFTAGHKYADDRGYLLFGISYRDEQMVRADDTRPLSILPVEFDDPSTAEDFADEINQPGCDPANEERHCFLGSRSGSTPGGVFEGDAWFVNGQWFNDQSLTAPSRFLPDGTVSTRDFFSDADGFNFRPGRTLHSERSVLSIAGHTTYELSPTIDGSVTVMYSDVDTRTAGGFETLNDDDEFGDPVNPEEIGNIASDHPFIPPEVEETRSGSVSFDRRLVELGEQQRINDRQTVRIVADLAGELGRDFEWEIYGTYGRFTQEQNNPNEVNFLAAQFALDIESDGAGGFQCVDAGARAAGCVPLDLFGEGTISEAAANYIRYNGYATQKRTQYTGGGYITGPIFELPAGAVKAVAGIEYRHEAQSTQGDPDGDDVGGVDGDPTTDDFNITSLATFPDLEASYSVIEGFAEIDIPVFDGFNLQAAARLGHYNTIGTIISYNAGFVWQPIDDFRLRGQFSRSQRAPNLTELFSPPRPDSDDLTDPCDGLFPDGTGLSTPSGVGGENADLALVAANCLSEPGIQAFFADPDNAGEPFEFDGSLQGPNSGNPNVQEETANTYTVGVVLQPRFIPGLTMVADYYRIEIADAITSVSTQDTVDLCYSAADFPNNKFCDVITRSQFSGEVLQVINFQENLNEELVSGIDATVLYDFELGGVPGEFDVDFRYSHYFDQEVTFEGIGGTLITTSALGEINDGNDEFRAKAGYRNGGFRATYTVTYLDGGIDDLEADPDPTFDRFFQVGGEAFHRIYLGYTFGEDDQYRIYGGVNNLFDNLGPLLPTGLDNGGSRNIEEELNDSIGREFYVGARVRF